MLYDLGIETGLFCLLLEAAWAEGIEASTLSEGSSLAEGSEVRCGNREEATTGLVNAMQSCACRRLVLKVFWSGCVASISNYHYASDYLHVACAPPLNKLVCK